MSLDIWGYPTVKLLSDAELKQNEEAYRLACIPSEAEMIKRSISVWVSSIPLYLRFCEDDLLCEKYAKALTRQAWGAAHEANRLIALEEKGES